MCGIVGQARSDRAVCDQTTIERMCEAITHRGPDSRGVHVEPGVGLGIQRLRVIDLVDGDQPIFNEDGTVVVVLNGEIYNFRELREELRARGHVFSCGADTEVIVHLYEELGEACVERLHGMFALAIWDRTKAKLTVARDRLGKKPLFYALRDGVLSFASELEALRRSGQVSNAVDPDAIDAYLAYRYVPAPMTAYVDARKLPPAHRLVFQDGTARIERYWRLDFSAQASFGSDEEAIEALREQLRAAVRRRLVSDVPLGAFLSGGVDSGAVVAMMAEASSTPVKTFSIGFESELDERPLARLVAERFGTDHHEFVVEPNAIEILPKVIRHHGEPFADATSIPTFYLSEMARRHVTVALNGDGGDEAFGGYSRYQAGLLAARLQGVPEPARRAMAQLTRRIPPSGQINSWQMRARRLGDTVAMDPWERHFTYMTRLQGLDRDRLYSREFRARIDAGRVRREFREQWDGGTARTTLDHMLEVDSLGYLSDDLLAKVDIATMACSLEARSPLLDHELMQFAASLPPRLKVTARGKKIALRTAMRGIVPDEILDAPKRGFQPPVAEWLRRDLRGFADDVLRDPRARDRGYFEPRAVEELLDAHATGTRDHSQAIWTLLVLELWHRELVDGAPSGLGAGSAAVDVA